MEKIEIICNSLSSDELYSLLSKEIPSENELSLKLEKSGEGFLALSPEVLVALITLSQAALTALIKGIIELIKKRNAKDDLKKNTYIEVKIGDTKVKAPVGATNEEIQDVVRAAITAHENSQKIKYIAIIEE